MVKPNAPRIVSLNKRALFGVGRKLPNFLKAYEVYTSNSEAAPIFHLWGGLGAISAVVGKNITMNMGKFSYLTNLYSVLVGPPGSKKTTAMLTARNLVRRVPGIHLSANISSPEALLKKMAKIEGEAHQSVTGYSLELGTFLGEGPMQRHMTDFLCDMYDGVPDYEKDTVGRGVENIVDPWFAFQSCVTPSWLQTAMSQHAVDGGFVSRTMWIFNDERRLLHPWPENDPEERKMKELLINDLTHISALAGNMQASPESKEWYKTWYMDPKRFPASTENRLGGYYDRKAIHLIKVAMLLSIADNDSLTIQTRDFETALDLLGQIEIDMPRVFAGVGKNAISTDSERIYRQVLESGKGGMAYGRLLAGNYHSNSQTELDNILQALLSMGRIVHMGGLRGTFYDRQYAAARTLGGAGK